MKTIMLLNMFNQRYPCTWCILDIVSHWKICLVALKGSWLLNISQKKMVHANLLCVFILCHQCLVINYFFIVYFDQVDSTPTTSSPSTRNLITESGKRKWTDVLSENPSSPNSVTPIRKARNVGAVRLIGKSIGSLNGDVIGADSKFRFYSRLDRSNIGNYAPEFGNASAVCYYK